MSTSQIWFWQQNRKQEPVRESIPIYAQQYEEGHVSKVEVVHQTEISCSNGHPTHYMKIRPVYDTYGYKEPGRVVCDRCGTTYLLSEPTLEE